MTGPGDDLSELDRVVAFGEELYVALNDDDPHRLPVRMTPLIVGDQVVMTVVGSGWIERDADPEEN